MICASLTYQQRLHLLRKSLLLIMHTDDKIREVTTSTLFLFLGLVKLHSSQPSFHKHHCAHYFATDLTFFLIRALISQGSAILYYYRDSRILNFIHMREHDMNPKIKTNKSNKEYHLSCTRSPEASTKGKM